jgi:hypothetical protein
MSNLTIERIVCDHCKAELIKNTSYPAEFALELRCFDGNRNKTGFVFGVHVSPPLDANKHFCGFKCLETWLKERKK